MIHGLQSMEFPVLGAVDFYILDWYLDEVVGRRL